MKFGKEIHQANFLILTPFTIKCDIVACVTTIFCHKCFVFKEGKDVCQEKIIIKVNFYLKIRNIQLLCLILQKIMRGIITTTHSSRPYNLKEQEQSQTMVAEDMDRQ